MIRAGYAVSQASVQAVVYMLGALLIVYLAVAVRRARRGLDGASRRDVIDLAPDAFFQADLDGRLNDVNEARSASCSVTREKI